MGFQTGGQIRGQGIFLVQIKGALLTISFNFRDRRVVLQDVADHQDAGCLLCQFHQLRSFYHREREWLLDENIFASKDGAKGTGLMDVSYEVFTHVLVSHVLQL